MHSHAVAQPATLLERLQADVRDDRPPPGEPAAGEPDRRVMLADGDRSVQVHSCTGRAFHRTKLTADRADRDGRKALFNRHR